MRATSCTLTVWVGRLTRHRPSPRGTGLGPTEPGPTRGRRPSRDGGAHWRLPNRTDGGAHGQLPNRTVGRPSASQGRPSPSAEEFAPRRFSPASSRSPRRPPDSGGSPSLVRGHEAGPRRAPTQSRAPRRAVARWPRALTWRTCIRARPPRHGKGAQPHSPSSVRFRSRVRLRSAFEQLRRERLAVSRLHQRGELDVVEGGVRGGMPARASIVNIGSPRTAIHVAPRQREPHGRHRRACASARRRSRRAAVDGVGQFALVVVTTGGKIGDWVRGHGEHSGLSKEALAYQLRERLLSLLVRQRAPFDRARRTAATAAYWQGRRSMATPMKSRHTGARDRRRA